MMGAIEMPTMIKKGTRNQYSAIHQPDWVWRIHLCVFRAGLST